MAVYVVGGGVVSVQTKICGESLWVVAIPGANVPKLRLAMLAAEGDFDPKFSQAPLRRHRSHH